LAKIDLIVTVRQDGTTLAYSLIHRTAANSASSGTSYAPGGNEWLELIKKAEQLIAVNGDVAGLQDIGNKLYRSIIPQNLRKKTVAAHSGCLLFCTSAELAGIPWELLYDGGNFWGSQFAIGRRIESGRELLEVKASTAWVMLLCLGPGTELVSSDIESSEIRKALGFPSKGHGLEVVHRKPIEILAFKDGFITSEIIHFCGHSKWDGNDSGSGLVLADGLLSLSDIRGLAGQRVAPRLVFLNSCLSCASNQGEFLSGFAEAFLSAGVHNFIGCTGKVDDAYAARMAVSFYRHLKRGVSPAEALRATRAEMPGSMWAMYRLFGDTMYQEQPKGTPTAIPTQARKRRKWAALVAVAGILLIATLGAIYWIAVMKRPTPVAVTKIIARPGADALASDSQTRSLLEIKEIKGPPVEKIHQKTGTQKFAEQPVNSVLQAIIDEYDRLSQIYLELECPGASKQDKEMTIYTVRGPKLTLGNMCEALQRLEDIINEDCATNRKKIKAHITPAVFDSAFDMLSQEFLRMKCSSDGELFRSPEVLKQWRTDSTRSMVYRLTLITGNERMNCPPEEE